MRLAIKFCGSCNPQVDLAAIAKLVAGAPGINVAPLDSGDLDAVAILCGCPRACGDDAEARAMAPRCLVVAGETVQGKSVSMSRLVAAVDEELGNAGLPARRPR